MTTTTRRTIIAGAATLPLLPAAALAAPVTLPLLPVSAFAQPSNATDAAWAAYEVAKARYEASDQAYHAFEAALPVGPMPLCCDFEDRDEWKRRREPWERERAQYPDNPFDLDDDTLDALAEPITVAEKTILATPAATLTDIERKLAVISNWGGDHLIEADRVDGIHADVRILNGARMMEDAS